MMSNEFVLHVDCGFSLHPKAVAEEVANITIYYKQTTVSVWAWSLTGLMWYLFAVATVFYLWLWNSRGGIVWWTSLFLMELGKRGDWHTVVLVDFRAAVWTDISPKSSCGKAARFVWACVRSVHIVLGSASLVCAGCFPYQVDSIVCMVRRHNGNSREWALCAFVHFTQGRWFGWRGSSL